jgi:hypothetical protein
MPAWMRKKSEPKKVETPTTDATSNDANKTQNTQQTTQSNLFQNQQGANKVNLHKLKVISLFLLYNRPKFINKIMCYIFVRRF